MSPERCVYVTQGETKMWGSFSGHQNMRGGWRVNGNQNVRTSKGKPGVYKKGGGGKFWITMKMMTMNHRLLYHIVTALKPTSEESRTKKLKDSVGRRNRRGKEK